MSQTGMCRAGCSGKNGLFPPTGPIFVLQALRAVASLLLGGCVLVMGNGLTGITLPIRLDLAGVHADIAGLVMSAYYAGFVAGSFYGQRIIARVGHIRAFGTGPLLLATGGLLLLCLLRTPLRWSGAALVVAASLWALTTPRPDVLVSADGRAAAIRGADGRLSVLASGRDTFALKEWLAADGDNRTPKDAGLHDGVACDAIGCIGRLKDGRLASMVFNIEAFAEDCTRAAVVVSARTAPAACAATLVDRNAGRAHGAIALRWTGDRFEEAFAQPPGYERPWSPRSAPVTAPPASPARDATPRQEDIEPGD